MHFVPLPLSYFQSQLPSANNTLLLQDLIRGLIILQTPRWLKPQVIFFTAWFSVLIIAIVVALVRKIKTQTFWLARLLPTLANGTLIVVSPTTTLPLFEFLFMVLYLVMSWLILLQESDSSWRVLSVLICLPLFCGGWCCAFAFYFSRASFRKFTNQISGNSKFNMTNLAFLGPMLSSIAVMVALSCLTGIHARRATSKWHVWNAEMTLQGTLQTESTERQRLQAAGIWREIALSTFYLQVGFLVYFLMFLILFSFAGYTGICLWIRLDYHVKNNVVGLDSGEKTLSDSILSAIVPVNAKRNGWNHEGIRHLILKSSQLLVRCVSVSVSLTSLLLSAVFGYYGLTLHSTFISDPSNLGKSISILIVGIGWSCAISVIPCLIQIGVQAFNTKLTDSTERSTASKSIRIRMQPPPTPRQKKLDHRCTDQEEFQRLRYSPAAANLPLPSHVLFLQDTELGSSAMSSPKSCTSNLESGTNGEFKSGQNQNFFPQDEVEEIRIRDDASSDIAFSFNSTSAPPSDRPSLSFIPSIDLNHQSSGSESKRSRPSQTRSQASSPRTAAFPTTGKALKDEAEPEPESESEREVDQATRISKSIEILISAMKEDLSGPRPPWKVPSEW